MKDTTCRIKTPTSRLGVLGGMGPAASAEFMRLMAALAPAGVDQEHPQVILLSDPHIPDRSSAILGEGPDPSPEIKGGLMKLVEWGADILAVPCNTAHFFMDRFRDELPVPLIHIVESTVNEAIKRSPEGSWLLSTKGTKRSGLYEKYASLAGYEFFLPDTRIEEMVQESINLVKSNRSADGGALLKEAVSILKEDRDLPIVAACTELPLAYDVSGLPKDGMISSLEALALKCLEQLYSGI